MMYIWSKFIAFILSAIAAMNSQIADFNKKEEVKQEPVQEIVQINEPEVPKETKVVKEEPEEVTIKVQQPTYYADHVYVNDIDVQIVEVDPSNTYQLQSIVDDPYRGVSYKYYHCTYIGDHSHEGFANLPYVKVNDIMHWKGKTYKCYYTDDNACLDSMGNITLSNGTYLYDQQAVALVTCKNDFVRYVRLFKEV